MVFKRQILKKLKTDSLSESMSGSAVSLNALSKPMLHFHLSFRLSLVSPMFDSNTPVES